MPGPPRGSMEIWRRGVNGYVCIPPNGSVNITSQTICIRMYAISSILDLLKPRFWARNAQEFDNTVGHSWLVTQLPKKLLCSSARLCPTTMDGRWTLQHPVCEHPLFHFWTQRIFGFWPVNTDPQQQQPRRQLLRVFICFWCPRCSSRLHFFEQILCTYDMIYVYTMGIIQQFDFQVCTTALLFQDNKPSTSFNHCRLGKVRSYPHRIHRHCNHRSLQLFRGHHHRFSCINDMNFSRTLMVFAKNICEALRLEGVIASFEAWWRQSPSKRIGELLSCLRKSWQFAIELSLDSPRDGKSSACWWRQYR